KGVYMTQASHDIVVSGNTFRDEARYGVQADTCDHVTIADNVVTGGGDHGIVLLRGTTSSQVLRNESAFNSQPLVRQANGIYMFRAPGNLIADNRCHDNQDTGIQVQSGSNDNLLVQNRSWNNGDHGFDNLMASGNVHI